jgi:hypothetical protein
VTKIAGQAGDLPAMMCIVLDEIHQHVHDAPRHPFHARLSGRERDLEQPRQIVGGLAQGPLRLHLSRALSIE